jgi:hypothetical protein
MICCFIDYASFEETEDTFTKMFFNSKMQGGWEEESSSETRWYTTANISDILRFKNLVSKIFCVDSCNYFKIGSELLIKKKYL